MMCCEYGPGYLSVESFFDEQNRKSDDRYPDPDETPELIRFNPVRSGLEHPPVILFVVVAFRHETPFPGIGAAYPDNSVTDSCRQWLKLKKEIKTF
jgi:hypothetical protein